MGRRISAKRTDSSQIWARNLANGDVAVALYNKDVARRIEPPFAPTSGCPASSWVGGAAAGGYHEACAGDGGDGNVGEFSNLTVSQAQSQCCADAQCAGFSWGADAASPAQTGSGYFKGNANCGFTKSKTYTGYTRASAIPDEPVKRRTRATVGHAPLHV